jgi:LytS/YehU family sensor histidine kinase
LQQNGVWQGLSTGFAWPPQDVPVIICDPNPGGGALAVLITSYPPGVVSQVDLVNGKYGFTWEGINGGGGYTYDALQSQLQPHFLFNALNDISSLIDVSPEKSQDAIADLSDLLRQTLSLNNTKFISVSDEIVLLKKYLEIEKIRFQDKLNFSFSVSEEIMECQMPPLLLQPIVENAVKHGFSYEHDVISILIEIKKEHDRMLVCISNNGNPVKKEITYGIGIQNVITRLHTLYEDDFEFDIINTDEKEVQVVIQLPIS